MDFTTPYDYLSMIADTFSLCRKDLYKIHSILDLSYTINKFMYMTAEEILFACILFILEYKPTLQTWIIGQSFSK